MTSQELMKVIKTRRSVRTFDGRKISAEHREKLEAYIKDIKNPYNIPVRFVLLEGDKAQDICSPVIEGEDLYVAAIIPNVPHSEEAFGFSFEKLVIYAWSLGIGTTWIAASMKRDAFENAAGKKDNEFMYCISPLGYPAQKMSDKETRFRNGLHADERKPADELFFDGKLGTSLNTDTEDIKMALEAVRLAPSAVNYQPWRIVKSGNSFHFYEEHTESLSGVAPWDVQKIDMGIALCHFLSIVDGECAIENPGISVPDGTEYVATITIC